MVCVCVVLLEVTYQHITILNALSLACAKSSIGSMQVGFLLALAGVLVRELFNNVGYWQRGSPMLLNRLRVQKRVIPEKHLGWFKCYFKPQITYQTDKKVKQQCIRMGVKDIWLMN